MRDRPSKSSRHSPGAPGTCFSGAPDTIRTSDLCLSGLAPYPSQPLQGRCRRTANRLNEPHAPVAQLDRALPSEAGPYFASSFTKPFIIYTIPLGWLLSVTEILMTAR
jgi:hypothetical protein